MKTNKTNKCECCGMELKLQVCSSAAGYYVGTECMCGPHSRNSSYFRDRDGATIYLDIIATERNRRQVRQLLISRFNNIKDINEYVNYVFANETETTTLNKDEIIEDYIDFLSK